MSDKTERQRENLAKLEKSGALSKPAAQRSRERIERAEAAERLTKPTNLGGGDGTKK
jgi:hypothetical protein